MPNHKCPECGKIVYVRRKYCSDECMIHQKQRWAKRKKDIFENNLTAGQKEMQKICISDCYYCRELEHCRRIMLNGGKLPCQPWDEKDIEKIIDTQVTSQFDGLI